MIYGPYSTGWRDESARRERAARWARLGLLFSGVICAGAWYGAAVLFGWL